MNRVVTPEILDQLEPKDPLALAARRDLREVNRYMQNARWMAELAVQRLDWTRPQRILDLGAGDGTFLLQLISRLPTRSHRSQAYLLDRRSSATEETIEEYRARGWEIEVIEADALEWLEQYRGPEFDLILGNLFLHHLSDESLRKLFVRASMTAGVFLACEPRRSSFALAACRLLWLIGCNEVTRHDAAASVKAGFSGRELSELWPSHERWRTTEIPAGLFTHCFAASCEEQRECPE